MRFNERTTILLFFAVSAFSSGGVSAVATDQIPSFALPSFERFDPLEMTGVFSYFTHRFSGMDGPVYVCEFDHWKSGGSFLGCTVSNDIPRVVGCGIQNCFWWEWYRLGKTTGETNLVVVAMKRWGDGSEDAGYEKDQFVTVFENANGIIRKNDSVPSFAEMVEDSSFSSLERPGWFVARRSTEGEWSSEIVSNAVYFYSIPSSVATPSQDRLVALTAFLQNRTNAPPVVASNVVFEADSGRTPFFALVSDGTDATEDGCLWTPFLWNGTEWTDAPTNGFACASGRCPASFRARTYEFYRLSPLSGEPSRLVILKNRNGVLREPFLDEALGPKTALLDFEKGMLNTDYMRFFGFPDVPCSVFQLLNDTSPFLRLERLVPENLCP